MNAMLDRVIHDRYVHLLNLHRLVVNKKCFFWYIEYRLKYHMNAMLDRYVHLLNFHRRDRYVQYSVSSVFGIRWGRIRWDEMGC